MINTLNSMVLAAATDYWKDEMFGFEADERFAFLVIAIGCGTGIIIALAGIGAGVMNAVHRRRVEEGLKRDMLDRGMSAEEIVKVIESATPPEDAAGRWVASWCKKK